MTPLPEEPAGFPEQTVRDEQSVRRDLTSLAPAEDRPAWLEVIIGVVFWLLSVAILAFVPVIVALPYVIYQWVTVGPPTPEGITTDKPLIFLSILGILPAHVLTVALAWLFVTDGGRQKFFNALNFRWPSNISPAVTTLLCSLLALVLLAIGWAVTTLWGGGKTQLDALVESSMAARIATALVASLTAPFAEEVVYRGVVYAPLERAGGKAIAIPLVSLLFASVHVLQYSNNVGVIIVITLLSFTLTFARAYTGSLVPPFIIHLVFNGIQSILIILAPFIDKNLFEKGQDVAPTAPGLEVIGHLFQAISVHLWRMT
ncbi:MAG TPA: type II CAAX endopeptidase family protein [Pyrinomonadaceae bacterium]|nr:type II CAAX endopeptidase family protein [Pyrinomonadaceae bacterium]